MLLASLPIYMLMSIRSFFRSITRALPLLALPVFSISSLIWSIAPINTVYYGLQYLFTFIIAIVIGVAVDRPAMIKGFFIAFTVETVLSLLIGGYQDFGAGNAFVFVGLMGSKNAAADVAALSILLCLVGAIYSIKFTKPILLVGCCTFLPVEFSILISANSTGALLGAIFASVFIIVIGFLSLFDKKTGMALFLTASLISGAAFVSKDTWLPPLERAILKSAHKDSTLTGRTYIWKRADILISKRPVLGLGYSAFWIPGNIEAEGIWRTMGIANKSGFNFHNTAREIRVHLGLIGLALFSIVIFPLFLIVVGRCVLYPTASITLMCSILIYNAVRAPFESLLFNPFSYSTVLLVAALASSFGSLRTDSLGLRRLGTDRFGFNTELTRFRVNSRRA